VLDPESVEQEGCRSEVCFIYGNGEKNIEAVAIMKETTTSLLVLLPT
jgi:hypothetical protein